MRLIKWDAEIESLHVALTAEFGARMQGVVKRGTDIEVLVTDETPADVTAAQAIVDAHDPAFIELSLVRVPNDGVTPVTVTVRVEGSRDVTLLVEDEPAATKTADEGGVVTFELAFDSSMTPGQYEIGVQTYHHKPVFLEVYNA